MPVIAQGSAVSLPNRHPLNLTGASTEVLKEADLVVTVGVRDIESVLKRPVAEAGIVPAGLPRVPSGYNRIYESLILERTKLVRIGVEDYGVKSWRSSYGRPYHACMAILGERTQ